ncbi:MAG: cyclic nucleotide-binding domain-containing protein [Deltaproteobacteria bacterium]|nr:cyclic nucleotide-binding domain-containing protein [Deltaproteobacteria bacterium]
MIKTFFDLLVRIPFFRDSETDDLGIILKAMDIIKVEKGKILFTQGDRGHYICFIVDGRFEVIKKTIFKKNITIGTLSRGQSFGEMAIIEILPVW